MSVDGESVHDIFRECTCCLHCKHFESCAQDRGVVALLTTPLRAYPTASNSGLKRDEDHFRQSASTEAHMEQNEIGFRGKERRRTIHSDRYSAPCTGRINRAG